MPLPSLPATIKITTTAEPDPYATERLAAANVHNVSLTNFDCIAEVAAETGYIRPADVARLLAFRRNPSDESWIHAHEA